MSQLILDPVSFFRSAGSRKGLTAVGVLLAVLFIGIAALITRMVLYVPIEDRSVVLVGYAVGTSLTSMVGAVVAIAVSCVLFWVLTWLSKDTLPLGTASAMVMYALLPGQIGALIVRLVLIISSTASTPITAITNGTSLAALIPNAPPYMSIVDPFFAWGVMLLALAHRELTHRKRAIWFSLALSLFSLTLPRI